MENPSYSIILYNDNTDSETIARWLQSGKKVIWFGNAAKGEKLKREFSAFVKAFLLQVYTAGESLTKRIIDGKDADDFLCFLEKDCPAFNAAQYRVEHCQADAHIVVEASAGTGKTKVMVDRILYLMHTVPGLKLSEIYMITFTRDAAAQMNDRLQEELLTRYRLTRQQKYLRWMEQQSDMNISTIHSFAYNLLKIYGISEGFTEELAIRSFRYEKQELVKDVLNACLDENKSVVSQLGVPWYRACEIILDFWEKLSGLGITHEELKHLEWGDPLNEASASFARLLPEVLEQLDEAYMEKKRRENAVDVNDIMRDLQEVLKEGVLPQTDLSMKYLFLDEFQDSDLSQISIACILAKKLGAVLFAVGDVKQSIYRFRGATDQAFAVLEERMEALELGEARTFTLTSNYRTAAGVLEMLDLCFQTWRDSGYLSYDSAVVPFRKEEGSFRMIRGEKGRKAEEQMVQVVKEEWKRFKERMQQSGKQPGPKEKVVVLTRSNYELEKAAELLKSHGIPAAVKKNGSFYGNPAVRDFYMMISSFLFSEEPKEIFNYLLTPYAGEIDSMNLSDMERLNGDKETLTAYLDHFLEQTDWKYYHQELRLRPVLSVLKEMTEKEQLLAGVAARNRAAVPQYLADLEKLMELLQNRLAGDTVSLYDIYQYLKLHIASDQDEPEAAVPGEEDAEAVVCMTVHNSKGLEFDTVILPFTNQNFPTKERTEILVDEKEQETGWNYDGDQGKARSYPSMENNQYARLKSQETVHICQEECRILYVAVTRAIHTLVCIVPWPKSEETWASLIEEAGVEYEW